MTPSPLPTASALRRLTGLRKDEEVREYERHYERNERRS